MGRAQIVRDGAVLAYEISVSVPGEMSSNLHVMNLLSRLEQHLAQIKRQDGEGNSHTPGG